MCICGYSCTSFYVLLIFSAGYGRALISNAKKVIEFEYDILSRNRRDTFVYAAESSKEGVKNVSNQTSKGCNQNSKFENCTITENFVESKNHQYYMSHYFKNGNHYFVDLSKTQTINSSIKIEKHERLSVSYKKAFLIPINFHFPFYGNYVDHIVVTTGGFINIGPLFHSFVHRVHYIAPLMADFNPSSSNDSVVYIGKSNDFIIVQWSNFVLNNRKPSLLQKTFTFQVTLHKNGTIVMAYKNVPVPLKEIQKSPGNVDVTVGFSDGFIITYKRHDKFKLIVHNLIYSYHKVDLPLSNVQNDATYVLNLLPNCIQFKDCQSCLNESKITTNFTCRWCPQLNQCSDTLDWHRQKWLRHCQKTAYVDANKCENKDDNKIGIIKKLVKRKGNEAHGNVTAGVVIGMLLFIVLITGGSVFIYAYTHPLSRPGIFLMENRKPWKRLQNFTDMNDFAQLVT